MANHNVIYVNSLTLPTFQCDDEDVRSVSGEQSVDLVGNELPIDTLYPILEWDSVAENAEVFAPYDYDALMTADDCLLATSYAWTKDITTIPYGTPVWYYFDENLVGKFYVKSITRSGKNTYDMTIMSPVGLLDQLEDYGGMYSGDTFKTVLAGILGGTVGTKSGGLYPITGGVFDCYVEESVGDLTVYGHLPVATKRENLHWLLFAEAVTITKATDGTPVFSFLLTQGSPTTLSSERVYMDGSVSYDDEVTGINLTEYSYQASTTAETIYSGSLSEASTIVFDDPYADITITGFTYTSYNCNCVVGLNGTGTITGKKYSYTTRTIHRELTSYSGQKNEVSVKGITTVNAFNSANVADRLMDFYSEAVTIDIDAVVADGEPRSGRQYTFTDPFGSSATGFVISTDINASGNLKASCHIVTDYVPTSPGNNFSEAVTLSAASGSWTVPTGITLIRAIIVGGGSGGSSGVKGGDGNDGSSSGDGSYGGSGGSGGDGGAGGGITTVDLTVTAGDTITYVCGAGGAGGVASGTSSVAGASGSPSSITYNGTTYQSTGTSTDGVVNITTGERLGHSGNDGIDGADGGGYVEYQESGSRNGDNLVVDGTTYTGGIGGQSGSLSNFTSNGGYGGGAAYGSNGEDGEDGRIEYAEWASEGEYYYTAFGGDGGDGADASSPSSATGYGTGGNGGNGGGGGGAGGGYRAQAIYGNRTGGSGGDGSDGTDGTRGAILIYY